MRVRKRISDGKMNGERRVYSLFFLNPSLFFSPSARNSSKRPTGPQKTESSSDGASSKQPSGDDDAASADVFSDAATAQPDGPRGFKRGFKSSMRRSASAGSSGSMGGGSTSGSKKG